MVNIVKCVYCGLELKRDSDKLVLYFKEDGTMISRIFCSLKCANKWESDNNQEPKLEEEVERTVKEESKLSLKDDKKPDYKQIHNAPIEGYQEMQQLIYENKTISSGKKKELLSELKEEMQGKSGEKKIALTLAYDTQTNRYRKITAPFNMKDKLMDLKIISDIYTRQGV